MKKTRTIKVGQVAYTLRDLRESLRAANDEAKGYLSRATRAELAERQLQQRVEELERMHRTALMALGATFK